MPSSVQRPGRAAPGDQERDGARTRPGFGQHANHPTPLHGHPLCSRPHLGVTGRTSASYTAAEWVACRAARLLADHRQRFTGLSTLSTGHGAAPRCPYPRPLAPGGLWLSLHGLHAASRAKLPALTPPQPSRWNAPGRGRLGQQSPWRLGVALRLPVGNGTPRESGGVTAARRHGGGSQRARVPCGSPGRLSLPGADGLPRAMRREPSGVTRRRTAFRRESEGVPASASGVSGRASGVSGRRCRLAVRSGTPGHCSAWPWQQGCPGAAADPARLRTPTPEAVRWAAAKAAVTGPRRIAP